MKYNIFLILGLILGIIAFSGCTSDTDNFTTKTFENENITFQYPETWEVTVQNDPPDIPDTLWLINIENPEARYISVVISEEDKRYANTNLTRNDSIKIDNIVTQLDTDNSTFKMYSFIKNNRSYEVIVYGTFGRDNDFEEYKAQFNAILNSIRMK